MALVVMGTSVGLLGRAIQARITCSEIVSTRSPAGFRVSEWPLSSPLLPITGIETGTHLHDYPPCPVPSEQMGMAPHSSFVLGDSVVRDLAQLTEESAQVAPSRRSEVRFPFGLDLRHDLS